MKNRIIYNIINTIFLVLAIFMLNYNNIFQFQFNILNIFICIILIIIIHSLKFVKIYLLLMEEKIPIRRFVKIYIKTTFVSIVLPYKSGEVYKMYSYAYETNNLTKGIVSVLIEKFYDALILCILFIIFAIFNIHQMSFLGWILLSFILFCIIIYLLFPSTYHYLNKFLIASKQSKINNKVLYLLEKINSVYERIKNMLEGRQLLLFGLSAAYWFMEVIFMYVVGLFNRISIQWENIFSYINDAFLGQTNILFNNYVCMCSILFLGLILVIYVVKLSKEVNNGKN